MKKFDVIKKEKEFDLTDGKIWNTFRIVWIPTLMSMFVGGTFAVFDNMFIANGFHSGMAFTEFGTIFNGHNSLAGPSALLLAVPYTFIIIAFGLAIGAGTATTMTKAKAMNDEKAYREALNQYISKTKYIGVTMGIFIFIFAKPLILMGTGFQPYYAESWIVNPFTEYFFGKTGPMIDLGNGEIVSAGHLLSQAAWYLRIQSVMAFAFMSMASAALILRVRGKANIALYASICGLVTNILLDFIIIGLLGGNLIGAAIATIIGQYISYRILFEYLKKSKEFKMEPEKIRDTSFKKVKNTLKNGSSVMGAYLSTTILLLSTTLSIGFIYYNNAEVITVFSGSFQSYFSLFTFGATIITGTAQSIMPLVTHNTEIQRIDRVKKTRNLGFSIVIVWAAIWTFVLLMFPNISGIFGGSDWTYRIVQIMSLSFMAYSITIISQIYLQSRNKEKVSSVITWIKPTLIFPLMLIMGFSFSWLEPMAWSTGLPWWGDLNNPLSPNVNSVSLGMFWANIMIEATALFTIVIPFLLRDQKDLNEMNIKV